MKQSTRKILSSFLLIVVLALAAWLRFTNLAHNPGWYTDEGTQIELARHLVQGGIHYFGITQSPLLVQRMLLFPAVAAAASVFAPLNMLLVRTLAAGLGVTSVGLIWLLNQRTQSSKTLPFIAALMVAIMPLSVLYSRMGYSYVLIAPLLVLFVFGLWQGDTAGVALAALAYALGALTDLWMLPLIVVFVGAVGTKRWQTLLWGVPLALLPLSIYFGYFFFTAREALLYDWAFTFGRVTSPSLFNQSTHLLQNLWRLFGENSWLLLGAIGLFLVRPRRLRWIALAALFVPIVALGRTLALVSLSFHYIIPLLPLFGWGVGVIVDRGAQFLADEVRFGRIHLPKTAWLAVLLLGLYTPLTTTISYVRDGWQTPIGGFLLNGKDSEAAIAFLNDRVRPNDIILASPTTGWGINAQVADFPFAIAARGEPTAHLPIDIPADRWAFDPRLENVDYLLIDPLWHSWGAVHIEGVRDMLSEVYDWPILLQSGALEVRCNPARSC